MIKLNNRLSLCIERENNKARLIIYKHNDELVCRKSSLAELGKMLTTDEIHLFKGRLQLYRSATGINVEVKGKQEGCIGLVQFEQLLAV